MLVWLKKKTTQSQHDFISSPNILGRQLYCLIEINYVRFRCIFIQTNLTIHPSPCPFLSLLWDQVAVAWYSRHPSSQQCLITVYVARQPLSLSNKQTDTTQRKLVGATISIRINCKPDTDREDGHMKLSP